MSDKKSRQYNLYSFYAKSNLVVSKGCIDYRSQRLDLKPKKAFGVKK